MERFKAFHFISFFQESLILKPIRKAILFFTYYFSLFAFYFSFFASFSSSSLLFLFFPLSANAGLLAVTKILSHCFLIVSFAQQDLKSQQI